MAKNSYICLFCFIFAQILTACSHPIPEPFSGAEELRKSQYKEGFKEGFSQLTTEQKVDFFIYFVHTEYPAAISVRELFKHEDISTINALVDRAIRPDSDGLTITVVTDVLKDVDIKIIKQLRDSQRLRTFEEVVWKKNDPYWVRSSNNLEQVRDELKFAESQCVSRENTR